MEEAELVMSDGNDVETGSKAVEVVVSAYLDAGTNLHLWSVAPRAWSAQ